MKKFIYIFTLVCFYFASIFGQNVERNVMWIHGLGGSSGSWETNASHHHTKYWMNSKKAEYPKGQNADGCSDLVKRQFETSFPNQGNNNRNIAVAHSFGGIVARNLEMRNSTSGSSQNFGGQIIVHSPQAGAQFAANFENRLFDQKFAEMWDRLTKPFKYDKIDDKSIILTPLGVLSGKISLDQFFNILKLMFAVNHLDGEEALGELKEKLDMVDFYDQEKIKDLSPNSDLVKKLEGFDGPGEIISVWGGEEGNILGRLLSSMVAKPGNKTLDIISDEDGLLSKAANAYGVLGTINRVLGVAADITLKNLVTQLFTGRSTPYHERARLWNEGKDYLNNSAETDWLIMIGAVVWQPQQVKIRSLTDECMRKHQIYSDLLNKYVKSGNLEKEFEMEKLIEELNLNPDCYYDKDVTIQVPVSLPNDGVVLTESQQAAGGILFENKNCNHFEALNTKVMSRNFESIFKDGTNGSGWFKTQLR
jgi:hypothetical protein